MDPAMLSLVKIKTAWAWLKTHWQVPFLLIWTIVVWVLTRRNSDAIIEVLEAKKESYEKQIKVINETHADELLRRDKLLDQYNDTIRKIEEEWKLGKLKITKKQQEDIKKFVIDSKGNPDEIKKKIEDAFGFTYTD
jgi:hypothetical protein